MFIFFSFSCTVIKFGTGENKDLQLLNATLISLANIYLKKEIQNLSQI